MLPPCDSTTFQGRLWDVGERGVPYSVSLWGDPHYRDPNTIHADDNYMNLGNFWGKPKYFTLVAQTPILAPHW